MLDAKRLQKLWPHLTDEEKRELDTLVLADIAHVVWRPQPGPQTMAYTSIADIIGFGGAAGGGKTDLLCGMATTQHERTLVARREKAQTEGIVQRLTEILGTTDGYSSQKGAWRIAHRLIEFAGLDNPGDERRWQGRPHDLKAFDEVTEQREGQVRFVMGWNRTNNPNVRHQTLMTFNPPTTQEGRWVIPFYGPWLDSAHPMYPTPPGELRYAAMVPNKSGDKVDTWLERGDAFVLGADGALIYDFDPMEHTPEDVIVPRTRTFIPARVTDNAFYMATGYVSVLQSLPEPLRSQMLKGDFMAGVKDDPWQVIPTEWVKTAQARWREPDRIGEQLSLGADIARGGRDKTAIVSRNVSPDGTSKHWFGRIVEHPGRDTPNGPAAAGLVIAEMRDKAPVHIDVNGVGASPYDFLKTAQLHVLGVLMQEGSKGTDKASGKLGFANVLSELWWRMRETLDPSNNTGAALPPETVCPGLLRELTVVKWTFNGKVISVQPREQVIEDTGVSPDRATALCLANMETPKMIDVQLKAHNSDPRSYDPYAAFSSPQDYDPYKAM